MDQLPEGYSADPSQNAQAAEQQAQVRNIIKQILTPAAIERLGRVKRGPVPKLHTQF